MILLSAHIDKVINDYDLSYSGGVHKGLLDNEMGVILTYLTLYDDQNLLDFEKAGRLKVWHGKGEEWGLLKNAPKLTKKDLVIVVDVACGNQYKNKDFSLENIYGVSDKEIKGLKEDLEWQGMKVKIKKFDGNPNDEDEAWEWKKLGIPVISFIIPIQGKDCGWHRIQMDNIVSSEKIKICRQGLKRTINHLI